MLFHEHLQGTLVDPTIRPFHQVIIPVHACVEQYLPEFVPGLPSRLFYLTIATPYNAPSEIRQGPSTRNTS